MIPSNVLRRIRKGNRAKTVFRPEKYSILGRRAPLKRSAEPIPKDARNGLVYDQNFIDKADEL